MINYQLVTDDTYWVGGSDRRLALFENLFPLPNGVSYNSYLIADEKTVLFDTADISISDQFMENLRGALGGRTLDYLVILHMEPDLYSRNPDFHMALLNHPYKKQSYHQSSG